MLRSNTSKILLSALSVLVLFAAGCGQQAAVKRTGAVIGIAEKDIPEYKRLHADAWPGVLKQIRESNVRNYSIYLGEAKKGKFYLFSYNEYVGKDLAADSDKMKANETTQRWWKHTDPLQKPLPTRKKDEWWAEWKEVFHFQGPPSDKEPKRFGSIVGLKSEPEKMIAYVQLHAAVWPGVLKAIEKANIRNYSIYMGQLEKGKYLLFSYFEYIGDDFAADMKKIGQDKVTQVWWTYTDPLQYKLPIRKPGDGQWSSLDEVFHTD